MQNLQHLSAKYLAQHLDVIDNLTISDCEYILSRYSGKRSVELSIIRPLLKNQISIIKKEAKLVLAKMRAELKQKEKEQRAQEKVSIKLKREMVRQAEKLKKERKHAESVIISRLITSYMQYVLPALVNTTLSQLLVKHRGRSLGNNIFDLPDVFSGYESQASVNMRKLNVKGYSPCMEHFNPRQWNGERISAMICEFIERGEELTFFSWSTLIYESCSVHKVTPEENQRLVKYQKSDLFGGPEESYKQAGVVLTKVEETQPNKTWMTALQMIASNNFEHAEVVNKLCSSMFNVRKAMELVRSTGQRNEVANLVLDLLEEIAEYEVML